MKNKKVKVFAPATIANLAVGFDQLGLAINEIGDIITLELLMENKIEISCSNQKIPLDPMQNTAGVSLIKFKELTGYQGGFKLHIEKGIPLGSGLGGSAASAVGAVVAANLLLNNKLNKEELLLCALAGETISGAAHYDNISPCLYGGITLISDKKVVPIINNIKDLELVVIHPEIVIKTSEARNSLPEFIKLETHIQQSGYLARFVNALNNGDLHEFQLSLKDIIIEPIRSKNIPCFNEFKKISEETTKGFSISGSGPTLFSFVKTEDLNNYLEKLKKYKNENISFWFKNVSINNKGANEIL